MEHLDYSFTSDMLADVIGRAKGKSSAVHDDVKHLSVDQQLKVCEIKALLAISQELNQIQHNGINIDGNQSN